MRFRRKLRSALQHDHAKDRQRKRRNNQNDGTSPFHARTSLKTHFLLVALVPFVPLFEAANDDFADFVEPEEFFVPALAVLLVLADDDGVCDTAGRSTFTASGTFRVWPTLSFLGSSIPLRACKSSSFTPSAFAIRTGLSPVLTTYVREDAFTSDSSDFTRASPFAVTAAA
jgi:hypothetical protein